MSTENKFVKDSN